VVLLLGSLRDRGSHSLLLKVLSYIYYNYKIMENIKYLITFLRSYVLYVCHIYIIRMQYSPI
jgi:hypothetical protein